MNTSTILIILPFVKKSDEINQKCLLSELTFIWKNTVIPEVRSSIQNVKYSGETNML